MLQIKDALPDWIGERLDHVIDLGKYGAEDIQGVSGDVGAFVGTLTVAGQIDRDGGDSTFEPA